MSDRHERRWWTATRAGAGQQQRRAPRLPAETGFTLVEALVALALLASAGVVASGAGFAMLRLERASHAEAVGLAVATEKLEELVSRAPSARSAGNDETVLDGVPVARIWRVLDDQPTYGLTRLEVTARWQAPTSTLLTLVTAVPGRSAS